MGLIDPLISQTIPKHVLPVLAYPLPSLLPCRAGFLLVEVMRLPAPVRSQSAQASNLPLPLRVHTGESLDLLWRGIAGDRSCGFRGVAGREHLPAILCFHV